MLVMSTSYALEQAIWLIQDSESKACLHCHILQIIDNITECVVMCSLIAACWYARRACPSNKVLPDVYLAHL